MRTRPRHLSHLTRREALGMLGTGAGAGLAFAAGCGGGSAPPAESGGGGMEEAAGAMPDVTFPDGAVIRTILGDIDPATLAGGATLFHEHLDINQAYAVPPRDEARSRDNPLAGDEAEAFVELVSEELRMAAADGLSCIVDAAIYRRTEQELEFLRQMATRSGVAVVAAGAYWRAPFPENIAAMNVDELTEHLITDARGQHWGAFGEVGTLMEMHETERTFLHAVSRAHHATNLPILTHTEHQGCPPCGLEQLDVFEEENVDFSRVCIGHLSDITAEQDPGWTSHLEIGRRGAYIGFDTVGRPLRSDAFDDIPEADKVRMVLNVLEAGYEDQVLLSADFANSIDLKSNSGTGFATTIVQFVPKLRHAGVDEATLHKITVDNPRRFLAFVPPEV